MGYCVTEASFNIPIKYGVITKRVEAQLIHLNRPETEDEFPSEIIPNYCTPCTINDIGKENIKDTPEETTPQNEPPAPPPAITDNRIEQPELKGQISLNEPTEKTLQTWEMPLSSYVTPSIDSATQLQKDLLFIHYEGHVLRRKHRHRHHPKHYCKHHEDRKPIDSKKGRNETPYIPPTPPSSQNKVVGEQNESFLMPTMHEINEWLVETKKTIVNTVKPIWPYVLWLGDQLRRIAVINGLPKSEVSQKKNHTISSDSLKSNKPKPSKPSDQIRNGLDILGLPH